MTKWTVTHEGQGKPLKVLVEEANVLMGMKRTMLAQEARALLLGEDAANPDAQINLPDGDELALFLLRRHTYPNCIAATVKSEGFDHTTLTFEEFCLLPDRFVDDWENAALDFNPHWRLIIPDTKEKEAEEKKDEAASKTG